VSAVAARCSVDDEYHVAIITPVIHYCMGGIAANEHAEVLRTSGPIRGLYCAGEVMGGVHGSNRLGGSSLLDCVVFGRIAGRNAAKWVHLAPCRVGCVWLWLRGCVCCPPHLVLLFVRVALCGVM
jgi:succinate dehydrogenase/fumarate reductase flavoprotein subunit